MIELKNLDKFFNKRRQNQIHVINNISLQLPDQGMAAIFGKSGCGKTTLLNVIGGLDRADSGQVLVNGENLRTGADRVRNAHIGYIFQNYNLNRSESCGENVADALRLVGITDEEVIRQRSLTALKLVGMDRFAQRLPDTLSGGQQQRVAIARAIVKNPDIVLADEPTGNLDESNTRMVMELLAKIAREHLVILVTHEEKLVDGYCDTVIRLKDGQIQDIRRNGNSDSRSARDKNTVYLGELEKQETAAPFAEIQYFGEPRQEPVRIKIVNLEGKTYLRVDTPDVHVINSTNEVVLQEGVYREQSREQTEAELDMSRLPKIQGKNFGRLFTLKSAVCSGFRVNFGKKNRARKALTAGLTVFAIALTMMVSVFGTSISDWMEVQNSYNHNLFFVRTPTAEAGEILTGGLENPQSAIDYMACSRGKPQLTRFCYLKTDFFESSSGAGWGNDNQFRSPCGVLPVELARDLPVLAGSMENLGENDMVLSRATADILLEHSLFSYLKNYESLINLRTDTRYSSGPRGQSLKVKAIVDTPELCVYISSQNLAAMAYGRMGLRLAQEQTRALSEGETILVQADNEKYPENAFPAAGEQVQILGNNLTVRDVWLKQSQPNYQKWLEAKGLSSPTLEDFIDGKIQKVNPGLDQNSTEYDKLRHDYENQYYAEFVLSWAEQFDRFLAEQSACGVQALDIWLLTEKHVPEARYRILGSYDADICFIEQFRQTEGRLPTGAELAELETDEAFSQICEEYDRKAKQYLEEYNRYADTAPAGSWYLVCPRDYQAMARTLGETHPTALVNPLSEGESIFDRGYTVIHSADPRRTEAWLRANCSFLDFQSPHLPESFYTPGDACRENMQDVRLNIVIGLAAISVALVFMCLCMYFIMRSSSMTRIREIGIWRAIGVSRRNIVFRFGVESLVLTLLTAVPGYLAASAFVRLALGFTPQMKTVFFYPGWMAVLTLILLLGMSLICGILPVLFLLRKTPSQILAKYDI